MIDSGTCNDVIDSTMCSPELAPECNDGSKCGENGTSHYETFEYNDQRVIIISGIPNHAAETDMYLTFNPHPTIQPLPNPHVRCK